MPMARAASAVTSRSVMGKAATSAPRCLEARRAYRASAAPALLDRRRRSGSLDLAAFEGVAGRNLPALHAGHEPAHALLRGAVGEAVGHDSSLGATLDRVVADG